MVTRTDDEGRKWAERANPDYEPTQPVVVEADGRPALLFKRAASAGVDIDPVDFSARQSLTLRLDVKVLALQERGNLILCSFGDVLPIRLGVPSSRPKVLYAFAAGRPHAVGPLQDNDWTPIQVTFAADTFQVTVGDGPTTEFANPAQRPNPRLYLGDGYEVDYVRSNWGSEFLVDLASVTTQVR